MLLQNGILIHFQTLQTSTLRISNGFNKKNLICYFTFNTAKKGN